MTQDDVIEECEAMGRGDILVKVVCARCGNRMIGVVDQRGPWHFYQSAPHTIPVSPEEQAAFPGEFSLAPGWSVPQLVVNGPEDPESTTAYCNEPGHGAATVSVIDLKAGIERAREKRRPATVRVSPASRV